MPYERSEALETPEPPNAEAGEGAFAHLITPAQKRFVRCHFPVPEIGESHTLELAGLFAAPRRLSLFELKAMPSSILTVVTECAGNGRTSLVPPIGGEQWGSGAVSTAQWTGTPLSLLLEGLSENAVELVFTGADGGAYQRSLPREAALDPSVLLAWEMNGAPIPPVFGGPLRLIVPGWYGMASVKWLARIEAVDQPFEGEFQTEKYVYAPGEPVARVRVKSMFTRVRPGLAQGLAWGGDGVSRVEVCVDGRWREARLVGPLLPHAWRRFEIDLPEDARVLRCRAIDVRGVAQPDEPEWNELGYGANGTQQFVLD